MNASQHNFTTLATSEVIEKTMTALREHNFIPYHLSSGEEALEKVKEIVPKGATLMNGSSTTLQEIGFIDILKKKEHPWNNLHDAILAETDEEKQDLLRRQSVVSDYYVGSAHAVSETGELVFASNTGSQLAHLVHTSSHLVLVVSTKKIVPTVTDAFRRIEEHIVPLEDKRMMEVYGMGTTHAKTVILHKEHPMLGRKVHVLLVDEDLGF